MANRMPNICSVSILFSLLSLTGCLGAPAETGLKTPPPAGVYQGQINSTQYNESGLIYGVLSSQISFGQPVLVASLAMNLNNHLMGIFNGSISATTDQSNSCLSTTDTVSTNPTSLSTINGIISFSNCQWNGSQFSANYIVYKQSSGIPLDSGTLTLGVNPACQLYPSAITSLPNGNYSGNFQSCLTVESSSVNGNITNSSLYFYLNGNESALVAGTVGNDYTQQLTESITAGSYAGYITPLYLTNLNQSSNNFTGNYVSYYDYGILNLSESSN